MENSTTHKTEVPGSRPGWPTKSAILEELAVRQLLMMLMGRAEGAGWKNLTKLNDPYSITSMTS